MGVLCPLEWANFFFSSNLTNLLASLHMFVAFVFGGSKQDIIGLPLGSTHIVYFLVTWPVLCGVLGGS